MAWGYEIIRIALTGDITMSPVVNMITGQKLSFIFVQDATGGRVVTWDAVFKQNSTPNTAANKINTIDFIYYGGAWIQTGERTGI
jgi:hypothetical protein